MFPNHLRSRSLSRQGRPTLAALTGVGAVSLCVSLASASIPTGYYDGVNATNAADMRTTVHEAIDDHTRYPYTSSSTDTWDILDDADEDPNNSSNILDLYKNASYTKAGGGNSYYNREHSWPKSYGFPIDNSSNYPYTDCHHLFACDDGYNSSRNNRYYDYCDAGCEEKPTDSNNGQGGGSGTYAGNSNWRGTDTWETWIGRKGDVARALLYLDVRYEGGTHGITSVAEPDLILTDNPALIVSDTSSNKSTAYMGLLSVLLEWHYLDPVDDDERVRNDIVYGYQGNRNPFIDHPEWVECIFEGVCARPWINEFHYDNVGGDTGEFVEIAGYAGTDLTGWTVYGYNGSDGTYYKTAGLSGSIPDDGDCMGVVSVAFSGMQNGPDGLALVDDNGDVVQFISYEGDFTATNGPASGMTSEDIGVSETTSTPVGYSLAVSGSGDHVSLFTWQSAAASTEDSANTSQSLAGYCAGSGGGGSGVAWINELHYDNDGADTNEFVEIAGTAGLNMSGWSIVAYNGSNGASYSTTNLMGTISDQQNGFGTLAYSISGLQNGAPDGIALVDDNGDVVQFLSYEGDFTATNGPADGLTSVDIGVSEPSTTTAGYSLQLSGTGSEYSDFTWQSAAAHTSGLKNTGQTFN
ncbi:MAG TPA: endonuclease [Phycisphaerae bacterium]|nr:endonuclease [Phycisphaerae bacterium]HRW51754.1 endonuclease [Phycisphaerae bacterium]